MATLTWPAVLTPRAFGLWLENADRSGGVGLGGGEQIVASPGPRWRGSGVFPIRNDAQVLAARALFAGLDGRFSNVALPNFDGRRLSWPVLNLGGNSTPVILHPGNPLARNPDLDGTAYEVPAIPTVSEINATVNLSVGLRATEMGINKTQGGALVAGQDFGLGQRLYRIVEIGQVVGAVTSVGFRPPLRAAATQGTAVLFTRPVQLMRIANVSEALKRLDLMRFADLELDFVEVF